MPLCLNTPKHNGKSGTVYTCLLCTVVIVWFVRIKKRWMDVLTEKIIYTYGLVRRWIYIIINPSKVK